MCIPCLGSCVTDGLSFSIIPIPLETFLLMLSISASQFSFSSVIIPKLLVVENRFIVSLPITTCRLLVVLVSLLCDPIIIYSVFSTFNDSLLALSHRETLSNSLFKLFSKCVTVHSETVRFVSSAYIDGIDFSGQFGKSFIYNKKRSALRFDP